MLRGNLYSHIICTTHVLFCFDFDKLDDRIIAPY